MKTTKKQQETKELIALAIQDERVAQINVTKWNNKYVKEVMSYPDLYQAKRYSSELSRIEYKRLRWYGIMIEIRELVRRLEAQS